MILGMVLVFIGVAMLSGAADPRLLTGILGWPGAEGSAGRQVGSPATTPAGTRSARRPLRRL